MPEQFKPDKEPISPESRFEVALRKLKGGSNIYAGIAREMIKKQRAAFRRQLDLQGKLS